MLLPNARRADLVTQELHDELMVYDTNSHEAHCLNKAAALVWKSCDGRHTVEEVARLLGRETRAPADERAVWLAVRQLNRRGLLDPRVEVPEAAARVSRRELVRALGLAAALGVPLITSLVVPTAAQAQSPPCGGGGDPCTTPADCCGVSVCLESNCS